MALEGVVCNSESKDESKPIEDDCKDKRAKEKGEGEDCAPGEQHPRKFHSPERGIRLFFSSDNVLLSQKNTIKNSSGYKIKGISNIIINTTYNIHMRCIPSKIME